jgi:tetratricopeptide (TPR) repeat protein
MSDDLVGKVLLHYELTERLGAGGMGVVYRALDHKLKRTVALKFLADAQGVSAEVKQRFMREAMACSALDHPNIGTLHAVEECTDGQLFLVMSCYEGQTLAAKMASGPIPRSEAIGIALQIASGLAEAHKHGIVHRDIKPGNLIFNTQGMLKILDFGLAKLHGSPELTTAGSTLGTAAYMAPEQALGQGSDQRADLWSLGVVLYEMLAGSRLFRGDDLRSTIYAVLSKDPPPIFGLPGGFQSVLKKTLQKDPALRYQKAEDLIVDLEAARAPASRSVQEQAAVMHDDDLTAALAIDPPRSSHSRWPLVAAVLVLLLVASAVGAWQYTRRTPAAGAGMRIAVLPLLAGEAENTRATASLQALADGLRDQLTLSLSSLERANGSLLIIPATQLAAQHVTNAAEAQRAFGVNLVLTGSLTATGDQLKAVVTSVEPATSKVLQSALVEGSKTDVTALAKDLDRAAANMLRLTPAAASPGGDLLAGLAPAQASTYLASVGYFDHWDQPGKLDLAIAGLSEIVKASPNWAPGYAALANAYSRRYQTTRDPQALLLADQNISHAVQLNGRLPGILGSLGEVRMLQGRYSEAIGAFDQVLALDDRNEAAYRGLAHVYAATGLPDKAKEALRKAVALRPTSAEAHNQLGIFEVDRGDYAAAAKDLAQASHLAPDNAFIMSNLGAALLYAGRLDESRRILQNSLRLAPSYASYTNLGNLDLKQNHFADAAADYEKALEINKSDYQVWSNLAVAYSRTPGQTEKAKDGFLQAAKMCREALKATPNDPIMLSDLAMFIASEGSERQEPLVLIEKALALAPQDTYVQFNAAETYESLGYRKEALDWITKLVEAKYPVGDINDSPVLSDLVKDKRYQALLEAHPK